MRYLLLIPGVLVLLVAVSLLNGAPEEEQAACLRRQREMAAAYERMEELPNDNCNKQKWL